tara:strand:+ start:59 stop:1279 length:1221 start_codon:yes stop_codon:yes gene_type:complete
MSLQLSKGQGIEMRRRRQTFHATSTGSYLSTSSSQVRIEMNIDKEVLDFETGYLMFDMIITKDGGTTDTVSGIPWSASSWIRDLRVYDRAGREIGEQVRQYNGLCRKQAELLGNEGANANYLDILEGATGIAVSGAGAAAATTSVEFAHKLATHIFDVKSYFPANKMGGLILEFDMEDVANVALMSGTTDSPASYTLSNVRYVVDLILLKPEAERSLDSQISAGGLEIHYSSYMNHSQAVTTNTNQRFDLGIANGHVKNIQTFQVLDSVRNGVNEDYWASFAQNNLSSYRFRLGSEYLTEKDVQMSATRLSEYLIEYLKSNNLDSQDILHFYGDSALVLSTYFTLGQKVEVSKDPDVLSGRRDFQANKVELELVFSSTPASATMYTHIELDKVLVILPGREFKNLS